jgi:hypothetical protein
LLTDADLNRIEASKSDKPCFAFLHWGEEFAGTPGPREQAIAARLNARGIELIIGSHPHRAGKLTGDRRQCLAFSLGNFIFDQRRPRVSGALLEIVFYPQGTYFLRLHPLGNLYEENFSVTGEAALTDQVTKQEFCRGGALTAPASNVSMMQSSLAVSESGNGIIKKPDRRF